MNKKIAYFMAKDTRLIVDNLSKVIIDENILLINYTILRKNFKDRKTAVIRYMKNEKILSIHNELKKYNPVVYEAFIEWAEDNGIEWYSFGKEEI